jgi:alginate O-acetyltransferase complex protein AlgI
MVMLALYWQLPLRAQNLLLLAGSYFFYGFVHQWFLILIVASTVVDYGCALAMQRWSTRRRGFLFLSLASNLGMLGIFKYFDFFVENVSAMFRGAGLPGFESTLGILLPVGISFYTFQTLSYTIDVYRGNIPVRRNFLDVAVFVAFFPQLVAGPIERASHFLPQVEKRRSFDAAKFRAGLLLIVWGFFKKLVIADNVAVIVNKIFALPDAGFWLLWTGVLGFCVQIFADFSAYTDIARGTARLFGFELTPNFRHPYASQNPAEFWRRWHISLSTWIRDYIYIPLGGERGSRIRASLNLLLTFFLCGLWHGASWNFVLWGLYHAILLLVYRTVDYVAPQLLRSRWGAIPRWALFFMLTNVGWLIFRETDLSQLLFDFSLTPAHTTPLQTEAAGFLLVWILVYSIPLVIHALLDGIPRREGARWRAWREDAAAAACVLGIWLLHAEETSDFIYFQF